MRFYMKYTSDVSFADSFMEWLNFIHEFHVQMQSNYIHLS